MKRSVALLIVIALTLVVAAPATLAQEEDVLLIWADNTRASVIQQIAETFTEEFDIAVEVQEIGLGDSRDQLLVAGPVGEGPDILIQPHDNLGQLVANGALAPIDLTGLEDLLLPSTIEAVTIDGVVYGLPYGTENVAFIRNPELAPEWPATWQQVAELAAQLAAEDKYALLVQSGDTYHHFPITTAFGGYIFGVDADGNYDVTDIGLGSEGGIASAAWLQMMAEEGYMVPDVTDDVVFELYGSGELAMPITGPWWLQRLRDSGQPYVIESFPGAEGVSEYGQPFSGVQSFVISAFSDKQLLAETFLLDYLATDETMQALFEANPLPSAWLSVREAIDDPDIAGFAAAGTTAVPMPNIPEMSAVWAASNNALNLIVNQQLDGETAYADAAEQIAVTIAGMGAPPTSVTIAGSMQAQLGCPGDWQPECEATFLEDQGDGLWTATFELEAGDYEFKCAMNAAWANAVGLDGGEDNIPLSLGEAGPVTFTYDDNEKTCAYTAGE